MSLGATLATTEMTPLAPRVIVAGPDVEIVPAEVTGVGHQGEVPAGLLDPVDLGILGQDPVGLGGEGDPGAGGDIIEDDGQLRAVGDVLIVAEALLGALVIIGGHMEEGVGAGVLGVLREVDRGGGVVAARAGDDLYPVVDVLDAEIDGGDVLPQAQGGALAGGPQDADGIHAPGDLLVDELGETVVVDSPRGVKGGDDGGTRAGKDWLSH